MTTPITTFQDVIDALERDPALRGQIRQHILTEALLQLSAVVGQPDPGDPPLTQQVRRITSRLGNVAGAQYEERVARRAISRVRTLGIERARIAFSATESTHPSTTPWPKPWIPA